MEPELAGVSGFYKQETPNGVRCYAHSVRHSLLKLVLF
jgi:hypothetical protein